MCVCVWHYVVGVEGVEIDANNQKVIIKGEKADPIKVAERLRKRSGKHVELVHPQPVKAEEKKKVEVKLRICWIYNIASSYKLFSSFCLMKTTFIVCFWCFGQPPKVFEVVLKINIHCEGCAKEVKHCIHNMEGTRVFEIIAPVLCTHSLPKSEIGWMHFFAHYEI